MMSGTGVVCILVARYKVPVNGFDRLSTRNKNRKRYALKAADSFTSPPWNPSSSTTAATCCRWMVPDATTLLRAVPRGLAEAGQQACIVGNPALAFLSLHLPLDATTLRGHALRPCQRDAASDLGQLLNPWVALTATACSEQRLPAYQRLARADFLRAAVVRRQPKARACPLTSICKLTTFPDLTFLPASPP